MCGREHDSVLSYEVYWTENRLLIEHGAVVLGNCKSDGMTHPLQSVISKNVPLPITSFKSHHITCTT